MEAARYSSLERVPSLIESGPTHTKLSDKKDGSTRPKSDAMMALALLKSASGSLLTGGGVDGGLGVVVCDVSNGFGRLSRNDACSCDEVQVFKFFVCVVVCPCGDRKEETDPARKKVAVNVCFENFIVLK